jgi:hypothetical protein
MAASSCRDRTKRSDEELRMRRVELAREKSRVGYRRSHVQLERSGERLNHKREVTVVDISNGPTISVITNHR